MSKRTPVRSLALCSALVLALARCGGGAEPESRRSLELHPCNFDSQEVEEQPLCGILTVPLDRAGAVAGRVELKVIVLPALEPTPGRAPLFMVEGGPGLAATEMAYGFTTLLKDLRAHRDVVLVDQRGAGESDALHCPEIEAANPLEPMYPPEQVAVCRAQLELHTDLRFYTTPIAARDLDEVRAALGYERVDLWGLSYGTWLIQTYMKMFPDRVRSAVLVGTVIPDAKVPLYHARNAQPALEAIFADCEADAGCSAAFPELRAEWAALLQRLEQKPAAITVKVPGSDQELSFRLERGPFAEAVRALMTLAPGQRNLPAIVHHAAQGDFEPLARATLFAGPSGIAEGVYLSAVCSEDTGRIGEEEIAPAVEGTFLGDYRLRAQLRACADWPRAELPADFHDPLSSDVPVLLIAGARDQVTPPAWAEQVAAGLRNSRVVVVEQMAHVPFGLSDLECFARIVHRFFEQGDAKDLDTSCTASMAPPPFAVE